MYAFACTHTHTHSLSLSLSHTHTHMWTQFINFKSLDPPSIQVQPSLPVAMTKQYVQVTQPNTKLIIKYTIMPQQNKPPNNQFHKQ